MTVVNLADLIRVASARNGNKIAIRSEDVEESYLQLDERSSRVAQMLISFGINRGALIGFLSKNRIEFFDILFGVAKSGAATVPINWRLAESEVTRVLQDANPRVLFVDKDLDHLFDRRDLASRGTTIIDLPNTCEEWIIMLSQFDVVDPLVEIEQDDVMY